MAREHTSTLTIALSLRGASTGPELQRELGISQPTLSRTLNQLGDGVVRMGRARSARYALRRDVAGAGNRWPVFRVDEAGDPSLLGRLQALVRDQFWFETAAAAIPSALSDGLPYFIQDMRPQGFIGRSVPQRFPELGLPERITDWNDDQALVFLARRGHDTIGNLILGDESLQRYLRARNESVQEIGEADRARAYVALADAAIAGAPPGSSAGGEHPKFTAIVRQANGNVRQVLTKFSPAGSDAASRRWADLLIAEHLAGVALAQSGLPAAQSAVVTAGERTFLEVVRFDRRDLCGRVGVVSLAALADQYLGVRESWPAAAARLASAGIIRRPDVETILRLATFGALIGNTDMHFGNLSFFWTTTPPFELAPAYDMLPMLYQPVQGNQLPPRELAIPLPTADSLPFWNELVALARNYWQGVSSHDLVSPPFAHTAADNAARLAA